jgi:ABC-type Mn2+/Zn2+ transport system ATPase subunit
MLVLKQILDRNNLVLNCPLCYVGQQKSINRQFMVVVANRVSMNNRKAVYFIRTMTNKLHVSSEKLSLI